MPEQTLQVLAICPAYIVLLCTQADDSQGGQIRAPDQASPIGMSLLRARIIEVSLERKSNKSIPQAGCLAYSESIYR